MHVGQIIRKFRKEKNMTLLELSQKSGVALATLSRVENGKMTGTLESHIKICEALDVSLPEFYKDLSAKRTVEVTNKEIKPSVFIHNKKMSSEMLAANAINKKMMPMLVKISDGGSTSIEETRSGVEKFVYVLDGKIAAFIGEETFNLTKGDTLYFTVSGPHYFKNIGAGEGRIIIVTSPPA